MNDSLTALLERAAQPGFENWRRGIVRLGGCTNPVNLTGHGTTVDPATGEVLRSLNGRLLVACGNRRAVVCPTCARVYRGDTYHLIRAGLVGGKEVTEEVGGHPRVFATLTAPGFGPVHTRREGNGRLLACRPRPAKDRCPHGEPVGCHARHTENDARLGEPLCPHCYDYAGAVLWQAYAGALWHRFTLELRRELARRAGLSRSAFAERVRLSYAKVAEYQRRGLIHFHAVIRLDGPDGPSTTPPTWATTELLADAVRSAAQRVRLRAIGAEVVGRRVLRFGAQADVRPIAAFGADERLTSSAVAGYIAKYATKGAEAAGATSGRIHHASELVALPLRRHVLRMAGACWWLGGLPEFEPLGLRRWAHMLGYRGHFTTKSRRYSTTLTALRTARATHRASGTDMVTVGQWRYAGRGYDLAGALIAASVRAEGDGHGAG
ncbi:replication initiator [Streptomyces radicis]|uniref:Replication initiation protein n=1 Tax=Streptomyces radicis TaxID=1750517 RepID=A0A3A9W8H4_9ACTN|nr:replication initiator [Streptomyces radicis]RKN09398.1 replication initiation protein [Streptomyces radicis]RKN23004.1 replication initiation protein [Streptomyces radicis]